MSTLDFLAIGDIATDTFIRLSKATIFTDPKTNIEQLSLPYGDKIPFEFSEVVTGVGNSANASVCASRLGLSSALIAFVGDDKSGMECIDALKKNGVNTNYIQIEKNKISNQHYVLWYDTDRTILVKHQNYKYQLPANLPTPRWLYLSSLGSNAEQYHHEIENFLKNNTETKLVFQPGTFQLNLSLKEFSYLYERSEVFVVNKEEAQKILKTKENNPLTLLKKIQELGPYIVVITDGHKGAYFYTEGEGWFMPIYPDAKLPYERTGAGDAYSATFVCALAHGKPISDAIRWSSINSMSVVQHVGPQKGLLMKNNLLEFLSRAPKEYVPKKLTS